MVKLPIYSEIFHVQKRILDEVPVWAALDSGCSLTKVVFVAKGDEKDSLIQLQAGTFFDEDLKEGLQYMLQKAWLPSDLFVNCTPRFYFTGVRAANYVEQIREALAGWEVCFVDEFNSLVRGFYFLISRTTDELDDLCYPPFLGNDLVCELETEKVLPVYPLLFVNLGSGIMIYEISENGDSRYFGGGLVGGKSMSGLASLLLGIHEYDELMDAASEGDRIAVDARAIDFLSPGTTPYGVISENDISYNMASPSLKKKNFEEFRRQDIAASVVAMFAHIVVQHITTALMTSDIKDVYIAGNVARHFIYRRFFYEQLQTFMPEMIGRIRFLKTGCLGAIGAMTFEMNMTETLKSHD